VRRCSSPSTAGRTNRWDVLGLGLTCGGMPQKAGMVGYVNCLCPPKELKLDIFGVAKGDHRVPGVHGCLDS
jgi:hypothetical protein